jgi:hypothetical protein
MMTSPMPTHPAHTSTLSMKTALVLGGCLLTLASAYITSSNDLSVIVVAFIFACVAVLFLVPTWAGILIYFAFSGFSPLFKLLTSYNSIVHLGPELILVPILIRWLGDRILEHSWGLEDLPLVKPIALFVLLAIVMMFTPMTTPIVALGGIISYVLPIAFFPLVFRELRDRRHIWIFLLLTIGLSVAGSLVSLAFANLGQARVARLGPGFAQVALQPGTVYFTPGGPAGTGHGWAPPQTIEGVVGYMIALILLMGLLTGGGSFRRHTSILATAMPPILIMIAGLVVEGIRLTIAGAAFGVLIVALAGRGRSILPSLVGIALLALALNVAASLTGGAAVLRAATLLNPIQVSDTSHRTGLALQIPQLVANNPLGQGMGRIGPGAGTVIGAAGSDITRLAADNMLYAILSELGIAGGVLLSGIAIAFIVLGWRVYWRLSDPSLKSIALGCTAASIALTATWYGGPTVMQAPGSIYFWGLAGLCFALPHIEQGRP